MKLTLISLLICCFASLNGQQYYNKNGYYRQQQLSPRAYYGPFFQPYAQPNSYTVHDQEADPLDQVRVRSTNYWKNYKTNKGLIIFFKCRAILSNLTKILMESMRAGSCRKNSSLGRTRWTLISPRCYRHSISPRWRPPSSKRSPLQPPSPVRKLHWF